MSVFPFPDFYQIISVCQHLHGSIVGEYTCPAVWEGVHLVAEFV